MEAEIEQYQKDKKGEIKLDKDGRPQRIGLDLTNDSNFYKTYVKVEGIINEDKNHGKMFSYLRGTFFKKLIHNIITTLLYLCLIIKHMMVRLDK